MSPTSMHDDWITEARAELLRRREPQGGWGYRVGCRPAVEPTVLASLGLLALGRDPRDGSKGPADRRSADWLASVQQPDGSVGLIPRVPRAGWPTAFAALLWIATDSHRDALKCATAWLIAEHGRPVRNEEGGRSSIVGHDPSLIGWPWIDETHSWLEPTSLAILALACQGRGDHPRVAEGVHLILDRSLPQGGWNYGNRAVFGRELRPQPGPTGLALVALASVTGGRRAGAVDPALGYLRETLPRIHAPVSLGWGVLGLKAWGACPAEADTWLAGSCAAHAARRDATSGLGLLLLAHASARPFRAPQAPSGATEP